MVDASPGEQRGLSLSLSVRFARANPRLRIVFRPLLFMIYLVRHSMNRGSMTGNTWPRSKPAAQRRCATAVVVQNASFALLNRRLRSFFDRTETRERAANLISRVSHLLSGSPTHRYIHLRCFLSPFFSLSQRIPLFIIVIVDFSEYFCRL